MNQLSSLSTDRQRLFDDELDAARIEMEIARESLFQTKKDLAQLKNDYNQLRNDYNQCMRKCSMDLLPESNKRNVDEYDSPDEYESNKVQRLGENPNNYQINPNDQSNKRNIREVDYIDEYEKVKKLRAEYSEKLNNVRLHL